MERKYIAATLAIIFVVLFTAGFFLGGTTIDIAGCPASWRTIDVTVPQGELCSGQTCVARPYDQQNNAIVDGLLCACARATTEQFADQTVNNRIEEVVSQHFGYQLTAQQICGSDGQTFLLKRSYD